MKKLLLLFPLLLLIVGCQFSDIEKEKNAHPELSEEANEFLEEVDEDVLGFVLGINNTYCDIYGTANAFWIDYNSDIFQMYMGPNGNDVPVMRALGKKYIDELEVLNIEKSFLSLKRSAIADEFSETLRLMELSSKYFKEFVEKCADLRDFDDFKNNASLKLSSYTDTINLANITFADEMDMFLSTHKDIDKEYYESYKDPKGMCELSIGMIEETNEETWDYEEAFIKVNQESNYEKAENGAFYITGSTSNNCDRIQVEATNETSNVYDQYPLSTYKKGDTNFKYGVRTDWDNLGVGENTYKFVAYCDGGQIKQDYAVVNYTVTAPSVPSYTPPTYVELPSYNYGPSGVIESHIDGDFDGWEGETVFKLENGQIWQQDSYDYTYHYRYRPEVLIYKSGSRYKMQVEGVDDEIYVVRLK